MALISQQTWSITGLKRISDANVRCHIDFPKLPFDGDSLSVVTTVHATVLSLHLWKQENLVLIKQEGRAPPRFNLIRMKT